MDWVQINPHSSYMHSSGNATENDNEVIDALLQDADAACRVDVL